MRNPYEVLRERERDLERVKREVEALRLVGPLLEGEEAPSTESAKMEAEVRRDATTGQIVPEQN